MTGHFGSTMRTRWKCGTRSLPQDRFRCLKRTRPNHGKSSPANTRHDHGTSRWQKTGRATSGHGLNGRLQMDAYKWVAVAGTVIFVAISAWRGPAAPTGSRSSSFPSCSGRSMPCVAALTAAISPRAHRVRARPAQLGVFGFTGASFGRWSSTPTCISTLVSWAVHRAGRPCGRLWAERMATLAGCHAGDFRHGRDSRVIEFASTLALGPERGMLKSLAKIR